MNYPLAVHFTDFNHPITSLRYIGIEKISSLRRGGDLDQILLKRESFWIHKLKTLTPHGLNVDLFKLFSVAFCDYLISIFFFHVSISFLIGLLFNVLMIILMFLFSVKCFVDVKINLLDCNFIFYILLV